jgi:hypothetical protein
MGLPSARGWILGLGLWAVGSASLFLAMRSGLREQLEQQERMAQELAALRGALAGRGPGPAGLSEPVRATSLPPVPRAGECRLAPEEMDAIALRVVALLQQTGASHAVAARSAAAPEPPAALSVPQRESLSRAGQVAERVLSLGSMTHEDVMEMRRELRALGSHPEADALRRKLAAAINQGRLVPPQGLDVLP